MLLYRFSSEKRYFFRLGKETVRDFLMIRSSKIVISGTQKFFRENWMDFGEPNLLRSDSAIIASNEMNRKIYHIDSSTDNGITASEG